MKTEQIIAVITGNVNEDQKNDLLLQIKNDPLLHKEYKALKNAWALSSHQTKMSELKIREAYLIQKSKVRNQKKSSVDSSTLLLSEICGYLIDRLWYRHVF